MALVLTVTAACVPCASPVPLAIAPSRVLPAFTPSSCNPFNRSGSPALAAATKPRSVRVNPAIRAVCFIRGFPILSPNTDGIYSGGKTIDSPPEPNCDATLIVGVLITRKQLEQAIKLGVDSVTHAR